MRTTEQSDHEPFTYHSDPVRIVFGAGAISALRAEADSTKCRG